MATLEILYKRAYSFLALALGDNGYDVASARIGDTEFFIAIKDKTSYAVTLGYKSTLKAARTSAPDPSALQQVLALPVLQVNVFGSVKKATIVLVAPAELGLAEGTDVRQHLTIETHASRPDAFAKLRTLKGFDPTKEIAIRWTVSDVQLMRPDLSDAEAKEVLVELYHLNSYECGINLPVVQAMADALFGERCVPCTLYPENDADTPVPAMLNLATGVVALEKDFIDHQNADGYTRVNMLSGHSEQVIAPVEAQPGEITLAALGDERFEAYQGYVCEGEPEDLLTLMRRLEQAGVLPDVPRK